MEFALRAGARYKDEVPGILTIVALLLSVGLACAPRPGSAPAHQGMQAYAQALRGEDPKPLYNMLSAEQKAKIEYEDWALEWHATQSERALRAKGIRERLSARAHATASVLYKDGQQLHLRQTLRGWRLDQALVTPITATSPTQALEQLISALARKDLPALFALMSHERRSSIEKRVTDFLMGLRQKQISGAETSELFVASKKRAELHWSHNDIRYHLVFIREGADWKLEELHMGPDKAAADGESGE